jgi:hypothetical protein
MGQRDLETVRRLDRDREAVRRHLAGERDLPLCRSSYRHRVPERDVDAAVLAAGVRVVTDREAAQHLAVRRPGPGRRGRCRDERPDDHHEQRRSRRRCPMQKHRSTVAAVRPGPQRN